MIAVFAALVVGIVAIAGGEEDAPCRGPNCPLKKPKKPLPKPAPKKPKPKPWGNRKSLAVCQGGEEDAEQSSWVNGRESEGEVLTADFPGTLYMSNIGSKRDGAGMCVMTSIEMLCHYLGMEDYYGLRDWCAREPGGAYRQKVADQIERFEKARGITNRASYLQYEGPNPEPLLEEIDKAGLPFAHSYGWSPRYHQRIAHMVANTKFSGRFSAVLDNNPMNDFDPATNHIFEWMSREEMIRRAKLGGGNMWIFVWLVPPPPPCPKVR